MWAVQMVDPKVAGMVVMKVALLVGRLVEWWVAAMAAVLADSWVGLMVLHWVDRLAAMSVSMWADSMVVKKEMKTAALMGGPMVDVLADSSAASTVDKRADWMVVTTAA